MKRGAPLRRTGWLRQKTPLRSKSELKRTGIERGRPKASVPDEVRALVRARSRGWCEMASNGCWGRAVAVHHRVLRKSGGRCGGDADLESARLSNLIDVCVPCHEWVHRNRWSALPHGWWVPRGVDPARRSVLLLAHDEAPVYLDDAGGWHTFEEAGP